MAAVLDSNIGSVAGYSDFFFRGLPQWVTG